MPCDRPHKIQVDIPGERKGRVLPCSMRSCSYTGPQLSHSYLCLHVPLPWGLGRSPVRSPNHKSIDSESPGLGLRRQTFKIPQVIQACSQGEEPLLSPNLGKQCSGLQHRRSEVIHLQRHGSNLNVHRQMIRFKVVVYIQQNTTQP